MLIVLGSVGIDFSALAIFSGAVGVGIGFGLQKIVSNLVSGIILLADKSIKPGDVITVGDSFGWVGTMGARYTSVVGARRPRIPDPERGLHHPAGDQLVLLRQTWCGSISGSVSAMAAIPMSCAKLAVAGRGVRAHGC